MTTLIENLKLITNTLWRVEKKSEFQQLLEDLLTPQEIAEITERIHLLKLLKK